MNSTCLNTMGQADRGAESPPRSYARVRPSRIEPRGLSLIEAAHYVGVSATKFSEMVLDGRMPQPKAADRRRIWCRFKLDDAFEQLPDVRSTSVGGEDPWAEMRV